MKFFSRIILASVFLYASFAIAQQRPQYSQYMMNQYLINPAVGGTSNHYDFRTGYRSQWSGITNTMTGDNIAPQTSYVSGHAHLGRHVGPNAGRHKNEAEWHHGIGGLVIYDKTGPTSRTSAYVSYSYNAQLSKKVKLSFGTALGFQQFKLDGSKLILPDQSTGALGTSVDWVPDMNLGFWLYHERFYFGSSINQIFQNKLKFSGISEVGSNKLNNHYFITGGYNIGHNTDLHIIPSFLIKYVSPAPMTFDLNLKFRYKNMVWAGVSYRREDAVVGLVGVTINKLIDVGYSYDYGTSAISSLYAGSHEIMLGLRLMPKSQLRSPSDFW